MHQLSLSPIWTELSVEVYKYLMSTLPTDWTRDGTCALWILLDLFKAGEERRLLRLLVKQRNDVIEEESTPI